MSLSKSIVDEILLPIDNLVKEASHVQSGPPEIPNFADGIENPIPDSKYGLLFVGSIPN